MKNLNWQWAISMLGCIAWWICVGVAICLALSSCTVIWSDDIFIVDALHDRNIDDFYMHRDPNGYMIQGKKYKSKPHPESIRATGEAVGAAVNAAVKGL